MAERKFNWLEAVGGGVGATVGALPGILTLNPALAVAGAGLGYGIGTEISPGGYWEEVPPSGAARTTDNVTAVGDDLNRAAEMSMQASRRNIERLLGTALRARDIELAGTGMFRSGERIRQGDVLREQAARDLANAMAGISLQREQLELQGLGILSQQDFMLAQLRAQQRAANQQLWGTAIAQGIPLAIEYGPDIYRKVRNYGVTPIDPGYENVEAAFADYPADSLTNPYE